MNEKEILKLLRDSNLKVFSFALNSNFKMDFTVLEIFEDA